MAQPEKKQQSKDQENHDLRGTLISVGLLGGFIILSWLGVWYLFISR